MKGELGEKGVKGLRGPARYVFFVKAILSGRMDTKITKFVFIIVTKNSE